MEEIKYQGAAIDPRTEEEKERDYKHEEIASAAPVAWVDKTQEMWRKFSVRFQDGSSSCMAQAGAKILGIENHLEENKFIVFSALDVYDRRTNKPGEGMWLQDMLSILSKFGATTEERMKSQDMNEAQMNAPVNRTAEDIEIAQKFKAGGYVTITDYTNIDTIADIVLNKGKGVAIMIFSRLDEWIDVPTIKDPDYHLPGAAIRHGIAVVDAFLYKGEKALLIDDSWGKSYGLNGQRILTESWIKKRCYGAGYLKNLSNTWQTDKPEPTKPHYTFTKFLTYGLRKDRDVIALQNILKYEQLFPQDTESTGNYLSMTAEAVRKFQVKHGITDFAKENDIRKIRVGAKSIALLNQLYSQFMPKKIKLIYQILKDLWLKIPLWKRQTVVETLETSVIVVATYYYNVTVNAQPFDINALEIIMLKTIAKTLRSNPNIPVKDYVNDQPEG